VIQRPLDAHWNSLEPHDEPEHAANGYSALQTHADRRTHAHTHTEREREREIQVWCAQSMLSDVKNVKSDK